MKAYEIEKDNISFEDFKRIYGYGYDYSKKVYYRKETQTLQSKIRKISKDV